MLKLKKMGFDVSTIKDKKLRKELVSLLSIYLDEYEVYGKPYEKTMFKPNLASNEERNYTMIINLADKDRDKNEVVDTTKKCFTAEGYKIDGNIPYNFDVIYDWDKETYTITGYPISKHLICHNDFSGSFSIVYDIKTNRVEANKYSRYSRDSECGLSVETHLYKYSEDSLCLISNYVEYNSDDVSKVEAKYIEKLKISASDIYKNGNVNFISNIVPDSIISLISSPESVQNEKSRELYQIIIVDKDNNIEKEKFSSKNRSLLINEIIYHNNYKEKRMVQKQKKYGCC